MIYDGGREDRIDGFCSDADDGRAIACLNSSTQDEASGADARYQFQGRNKIGRICRGEDHGLNYPTITADVNIQGEASVSTKFHSLKGACD